MEDISEELTFIFGWETKLAFHTSSGYHSLYFEVKCKNPGN
jgi:hypothetical protein